MIPEMLDAALDGPRAGDVGLRRGHRADRSRRAPRRGGARRASTSSSSTTSSRTRPPASRTSSCRRGFLEKTGTFTNAERRLQLVQAGADPPGEAKTDLDIFKLVSARLGYELPWDGPEDVMDEIAELTPHFAGVSYERLGRGGLQWPVAPDGTDRRSSSSTSSRCRAAARAWRRCRTSRRARGERASSRSSSSPAGGSSTTTSARRRGAPATSSCCRPTRLEIHPDDAERARRSPTATSSRCAARTARSASRRT